MVSKGNYGGFRQTASRSHTRFHRWQEPGEIETNFTIEVGQIKRWEPPGKDGGLGVKGRGRTHHTLFIYTKVVKRCIEIVKQLQFLVLYDCTPSLYPMSLQISKE